MVIFRVMVMVTVRAKKKHYHRGLTVNPSTGNYTGRNRLLCHVVWEKIFRDPAMSRRTKVE